MENICPYHRNFTVLCSPQGRRRHAVPFGESAATTPHLRNLNLSPPLCRTSSAIKSAVAPITLHAELDVCLFPCCTLSHELSWNSQWLPSISSTRPMPSYASLDLVWWPFLVPAFCWQELTCITNMACLQSELRQGLENTPLKHSWRTLSLRRSTLSAGMPWPPRESSTNARPWTRTAAWSSSKATCLNCRRWIAYAQI